MRRQPRRTQHRVGRPWHAPRTPRGRHHRDRAVRRGGWPTGRGDRRCRDRRDHPRRHAQQQRRDAHEREDTERGRSPATPGAHVVTPRQAVAHVAGCELARRHELVLATDQLDTLPAEQFLLVDHAIHRDWPPTHSYHRCVAIAPAWAAPRSASGATPIGGRCPRRRAPGAEPAARTRGVRCSAGSIVSTVGPQRSVPTVSRTVGHREAGEDDAEPRAVRGTRSGALLPDLGLARADRYDDALVAEHRGDLQVAAERLDVRTQRR